MCFGDTCVPLSCSQSRRLLLMKTSLCFSSFVWLIAASLDSWTRVYVVGLNSAWTEQLQSCLDCLGHHRALRFCLCVVSSGCWACHSFLSRDVTFSVLEAPVQKEVERVVSDQRKVSFPTKVKGQIWLFWGSEHRLCPWWSWAVHMSWRICLKPNFEQCKQEGE